MEGGVLFGHVVIGRHFFIQMKHNPIGRVSLAPCNRNRKIVVTLFQLSRIPFNLLIESIFISMSIWRIICETKENKTKNMNNY